MLIQRLHKRPVSNHRKRLLVNTTKKLDKEFNEEVKQLNRRNQSLSISSTTSRKNDNST